MTLLPLDDTRSDELAVYFGFLGRPPTVAVLREIRQSAEARSREGITAAVGYLHRAGLVHRSRDLEATVDGLYPLVDGLALHGTLWPERYPAPYLRRVLHGALDALQDELTS